MKEHYRVHALFGCCSQLRFLRRSAIMMSPLLVVYVGEPHGLAKQMNRRAKMAWDLAWYEKYLKNK